MAMSRRTSAVLVGLGLLGAAALAAAQVERGPRTLHEDLPSPTGGDSPLLGADPKSGGNPTAFASGDKVLPAPELAPKTGDEPVFGRQGAVTDRDTESRLDASTGADDTLHYTSVFNPEVMPFKRMNAFDGIGPDYANTLRDPELRLVPIGGTTDRARDRFWASIMIELAPGATVPIPSVAPDMRILSYETHPTTAVTFAKDSADNFYVRADGGGRGQVRLVFLADADAGYFAPQLPSRAYSVGRVRTLARDAGLLPTLPPEVAATAQRALAELKLSTDDELGTAFNTLVYYFRGFEAKPIPNPTGDIYWDLYKHQAGVCRHRSATFTITANALGIPTRYVYNEAHAFVEVWFPERGWQRIDLGGAASRLDVANGEDKTIHRPRGDDPFAKPKAYTENYTQLSGDITGLSQQQLDEARASLDDRPASGDYDGPGAGPGPGNDDAVFGPGTDKDGLQLDPAKPVPMVTVTLVDAVGYRGEGLTIEGRVDAPGVRGVAGLRVDVSLAPVGREGFEGRPIGRAVTAADGSFVIDAVIPADLNLAAYEVYVSTRGDARYNPAMSD
jgi:hypothetical protein